MDKHHAATEYDIIIEASDEAGEIWQAIYTERVDWDGTAIDLAEDTAQNQNAADGAGWRVRIYPADGDTHIAEAGPAVEGVDITNLYNRIGKLASLSPIERATEAARLADDCKTTLARIRRAAVYEATRTASWSEVAAHLGVSTAAINQMVTQHRRGA